MDTSRAAERKRVKCRAQIERRERKNHTNLYVAHREVKALCRGFTILEKPSSSALVLSTDTCKHQTKGV